MVAIAVLTAFLSSCPSRKYFFSELTHHTARRVSAIKEWNKLPLVVWLVFAIFVDSWLFVFVTAILKQGVGLNSSFNVCSAGIFVVSDFQLYHLPPLAFSPTTNLKCWKTQCSKELLKTCLIIALRNKTTNTRVVVSLCISFIKNCMLIRYVDHRQVKNPNQLLLSSSICSWSKRP